VQAGAETCLAKLTLLRSVSPGGLTREPPATKDPTKPMERNVTRLRAADDFEAIRARIEDLRRERERAHATEGELQSVTRTHRGDRVDPVTISVRRLRNAAG
jgi:hypothetical protein